MTEVYIRDFNKRIIGIVRTDTNGDQTAIDFATRQTLGYYRKTLDHTTDFYGRILYKGNMVSLLFNRVLCNEDLEKLKETDSDGKTTTGSK